MSSSPEPILRGAGARAAAIADFTVDLGSVMPVPSAGVTRAREAARAAGYADGWAQGQRAGRAVAQAAADQLAAAHHAATSAHAAAVGRALAAVARAAADLDSRAMPGLETISELVLSAAVDLAETILGYEVSQAENSAPGGNGALAAVRRAMSLVPSGDGPVTVRLSPEDHRSLISQGDAGLQTGLHAGLHTGQATVGESTYAFEGRAITVRGDGALAQGDAVAEYGVTTVDATLASAIARLREVLSR